MDDEEGNNMFPVVSIRRLTENYFNGNASNVGLHDDPDIKDILSKLTDAFTKWGFVYLVDHGIETTGAFKVSQEFFEKEMSFKEQYLRASNEINWGYVPFKFKTFEKGRPFDLKECFNFNTEYNLSEEKMGEMSEFVNVATKLSHDCHVLTNLLLTALSPAILKDSRDFLLTKHQNIGKNSLNPTTLRLLYYPATENDENIMENQLRCGEHSDYGTITLLFQDDIGGLQVVSPSGDYVDAVPIPGSIVVNIGDMMEVWTSGRFKSTRHRVLINNKHKTARQSLAYFVHPDNDVMVSCLDGSNKFESVNAYSYLMNKFADTY